MKHVVVRYTVKPDRLVEHEALIARVFEELAQKTPGELRYEVFKLADGLSFVHVATHSKENNPLRSIEAFKAFGTDIASRVEAPPIATEGERVGCYKPGT
jgi:hypothetical protein